MTAIKGPLNVNGVVTARDIVIKRGKHGDISYKHRQKWKKLHIGTQGQVLTVDADGFPSWQAPSGGATMQTGTYVGTGALVNQDIVVGFTADFIQVSQAESPASGIVAHRTPEMVTLNGPAQFCIIIDDLAGPGNPGINPVPWLTQPVANQFRVTQDLNVLNKVYFWVAFNKQGTA